MITLMTMDHQPCCRPTISTFVHEIFLLKIIVHVKTVHVNNPKNTPKAATTMTIRVKSNSLLFMGSFLSFQ